MRLETTKFEAWRITAIVEVRTISNQLYTDPFRVFADTFDEDLVKDKVEDVCWGIVGENEFGSVKLLHVRGKYDDDSYELQESISESIITEVNR